MLKSLFKHDTTLAQIRESLLKTRRLQGCFGKHKWSVELGKPENDGFIVIPGAAWRENPERHGLFVAWKTDAALDSFLKKKSDNAAWVAAQIARYEEMNPSTKKEWPEKYHENVKRLELSAPNSWLEMSRSAETGLELDLGTIHSLIHKEELEQLFLRGNLPQKPTVVNLWSGVRGLQPVLMIAWNTA